MIKMQFYFSALFAVMFLNSTLFAQPVLEIVEPVNNSIYEETHASVIIKINDDIIDKVEITTDEYKNFTTNVNKDKRDYYCKSARLHPGLNQFLIRGYSEGKLVAEARSSVFYKTPIVAGYHFAPKTFKKTFFHTDEKERICSKCHAMIDNSKKNVAFIDVKESNCYECHKGLTADRYAHAPASNWVCTKCHSTKAGKKNQKHFGKSKYLTQLPVIDSCFACHKDEDKVWWDKKYQHDPVSEGRCNKCHNLHSSNFKNFIRKSPWNLCISCHETKLSRKELLAEDANLTKENLDEFICIKCHDPHKSDRRYFLKKNVKDAKEICKKLDVELEEEIK